MPSYSPVFSQAFVEYSAAAPNESFLVPEGFTAVVRQIALYQEAGGSTVVVSIQNSDAAPVMTFAALGLTGTVDSTTWEGRVVCPGGGTISIYPVSLGTGAFVYVGGYLLRNNLT